MHDVMLFWLLPFWYLDAALNIPKEPFGLIVSVGFICLLIGCIWGVVIREKRLSAFLLPFAASQIFVAISGFMQGKVAEPMASLVLLSFITLQLAGAGYLIFTLKGARLPATLLAIFAMSYAAFAAFIAAMAFANDWI